MTRPYRVAPDYLRTAQVAALLHVSPKTITRWAKEGRLPCAKTLGGHRRYVKAEVEALLEQLTYRPTAQTRRQR